MNWDEVIFILLGAVLAIATTFVTELFSDWHETRTKRVKLERFLAAELPNCVSKMNSLLGIYGQNQVPEPAFLVSLEQAVSLFAKYREIVYSLDIATSQQVLAFYDSVAQAVEMILSMLRLAQETDYEDYASTEIRKQIQVLQEAHSIGKSLAAEFNCRAIKQHSSLKTKG